MAASIPLTDENHQDKSSKVNGIGSDKNVLCDINNLTKRDSYNDRSVFYKKPIKKHNYKLEVDFNETPQEIRRQRILYYQKKNREDLHNANRGLLENVLNPENEEEMEEEADVQVEEEMEIDVAKKRHYKPKRRYANKLMLSEWMLDVPQDYAENWIMIPCPLGKRVLVVASKRSTKVYSRRGTHLFTFKSVLPGGSTYTFKNNCTILDCIWIKDKKVLYALDVLAWSNQEMLNCESEFRFFWLQNQLAEIELSEMKNQEDDINEYQILSLPKVYCNQDFLECLMNFSMLVPIDGILFYHKEAHYTSGRTPLVAWLKPYMLPEVLGVSVPESCSEKPSSYISFEHHVLTVIQNEKKKTDSRQKHQKCNYVEEEEME